MPTASAIVGGNLGLESAHPGVPPCHGGGAAGGVRRAYAGSAIQEMLQAEQYA